MPRRVRYRCSIRQFLNRPGHHGKAAIIASVEDTRHLNPEELRYPRAASVYLNISDCSRHVTLAFDIDTRDAQANSMYKINTLLGALVRFRDALVAEAKLYNERQAELSPKRRRNRTRNRAPVEEESGEESGDFSDAFLEPVIGPEHDHRQHGAKGG